ELADGDSPMIRLPFSVYLANTSLLFSCYPKLVFVNTLAVVLLLPVPVFAGFISFSDFSGGNTWTVTAQSGVTLDSVGDTGSPNVGNVLNFSPTVATGSNGSMTLQGKIAFLSVPNGETATLTSNLASGSLAIRITDTTEGFNFPDINANNSSNQFSSSTS